MKPRFFEHINDCWNALRECETLDEVRTMIGQFPNCFGKWYVENENGSVLVTNEYFDGQLDDWFTEDETLDVDWTDDED